MLRSPAQRYSSSDVASSGDRGKVVVIGAGPAGLTAAYELLQQTNLQPVLLEAGETVGGLSRTANYKGNRIDIGGHRFFSKSNRILEWWLKMLPMEIAAPACALRYKGSDTLLDDKLPSATGGNTDRVMLLRERRSHIYCFRKFFDYPLKLSIRTMSSLGVIKLFRASISYFRSICFPIANEQSLEDFLINRFGRYLYCLFFQSYTEKVWGVPCSKISAEWGAQRIKGLSISRAIAHALRKPFRKQDVAQRQTETSLIERFLYPKLGPGQLWDVCAERIEEAGGKIHLEHQVTRVEWDGNRICCVYARDRAGNVKRYDGEYFISTMPVQDLIAGMGHSVPLNVQEVAQGLVYRDFVTLGLLVRKLKPHYGHASPAEKDTWIYIQDPEVRVGRLQIFNNWSPSMVASSDTIWLGLEYFCNKGDDIWTMEDCRLSEQGADELDRIGLIDKSDVLDFTVLRVEKTYPAYFGTHDRFCEIREFLDGFDNLFLIGRNGMHRYNNQDHSMLTAMEAVNCIRTGNTDKSGIWEINTEKEYHEERTKQSHDANQSSSHVSV